MPLLKSPPTLQTSCLDVVCRLPQEEWNSPHIATWLPRITWKQPHNISGYLYQALLDHLVQTKQLQPWHVDYVVHESLTSLKFANVWAMDPDCATIISIRCGNLQDITFCMCNLYLPAQSICMCKQMSPSGMHLILLRAPQLRVLDLTHTTADDETMGILASTCPELLKLDMSETNVTDIGLFDLCGLGQAGKGCLKIIRLMIHSLSVTLFGLSYVLKALKHLRELGTDLNSGLVLYGIYHDFLLHNVPLTPLMLKEITFSSMLEESFPVPPSYVRALKLCPNLTCLTLRADMVRSMDKEILQGLSFLDTLQVDEERYGEGTFQRDIVPFLSKVGAKIKLVTFNGFSDIDMLAISVHCPMVDNITLENVMGFAEQPVQQIRDCAFEYLDFLVIQILEEVPQEPLLYQLERVLKNAPVLSVLHLWGVQCCTDDFMADVMKHNKLEFLSSLRLIECHHVSSKTIKALLDTANYFGELIVEECNKLKKEDLQDLRQLAASRNLSLSIIEGWRRPHDQTDNGEAQWAAM